MRVLLTGANGFIGRYLLSALIQAGHEVVPAVRRPQETDRLPPRPASIRIDFNRATEPAGWAPHLSGIDAVINCAGILQGRPGQSIDAIHARAPIALFQACEAAGVRRVIQISAISAEPGVSTDYAATKHAADAWLAATGLDWVILRPSLVYAQGAHGGTALFRAIAALPFVTPLPGDGRQQFQPIHIDDLMGAIVRILADPSIRCVTIDPVGPEPVSLRQLFADLRQWLGYRPVPAIPIPMPLIRLAARIGDVIGGSLNTTAIRQVEFGNTGPVEPFIAATGIRPRGWKEGLNQLAARTQDRRDARLYFLRPLLWAASGFSHPRLGDDRGRATTRSAIARVLGDDFDRLPVEVRTAHGGETLLLAGRANADVGPGWIPALIRILFGFPRLGRDMPVTIAFSTDASGRDSWRRDFDGRRYSSRMEPGSGRRAGLLVERQQLFTWVFRLSVDADRRLILDLAAADILGIPMPWALAPRCHAFETGADGRFTFDITVDLPVFGRLIRYSGVMEIPA